MAGGFGKSIMNAITISWSFLEYFRYSIFVAIKIQQRSITYVAKNLRFQLDCIIISSHEKPNKKKKKNHTTIRFYKVKHPLSRQWFTGYGIETGPHAGACKSCRGWYLMKHSCGHRHPWHRLKLRAKNVLEGCGIGTFKRFRGYVVFRLDFSL